MSARPGRSGGARRAATEDAVLAARPAVTGEDRR